MSVTFFAAANREASAQSDRDEMARVLESLRLFGGPDHEASHRSIDARRDVLRAGHFRRRGTFAPCSGKAGNGVFHDVVRTPCRAGFRARSRAPPFVRV